MKTDMSSSHNSFTIGELASLTGFSIRTIHFYVQQELLPRIGRVGPGVRYPRRYLDLLLEIRALKASRLTLPEIRERLGKRLEDPLPDPLQGRPPDGSDSEAAAPTEGAPSAEPGRTPAPETSPPTLQEFTGQVDLSEILTLLDRWAPPSEVPRVSRRTRWTSAPLTERLSLVGRDLRSHELSVLERIADHLRALFEEGS